MPKRPSHQKKLTLGQVARAAHVSPSTASAALRGSPLVHPETRLRVEEAAKRLGYHPFIAAQALRGGKAPFVGVFGYFTNSWPQTEVVWGISSKIQSTDYSMFLFPDYGQRTLDAENRLNRLADQRLLGAIVALIGHGIKGDTLTAMLLRGIPVVTVEFQVPGAHSVEVDNVSGGALAAEHLARSAKRFVIVSGEEEPAWADERLRGFRVALSKFGFKASSLRQLTVSQPGFDQGRGLTRALVSQIRRGPAPGIFCPFGDMTALGLLRGLVESGFQPMKDFFLVGYDDIAAAGFNTVPLTTVHQPLRELGLQAAELALQAARNPMDSPVHRVLRPMLIVRSTA